MAHIGRRAALLSALALLCPGAALRAQEAASVPSADVVMADALKTARNSKRVVFARFGATW